MQGTLIAGLVFACLLHGGDHDPDIRKFAGIWYHTGEVVNGSLQNEFDSVKISAKVDYNGGVTLELHRVRDGKCEQDVIFLAPTDDVHVFETVRVSTVRIAEVDFNRYCIIHVAALNYESTFAHLFTRTPEPSDDDKLKFEFQVGLMMKFDLNRIVYLSGTDQCP